MGRTRKKKNKIAPPRITRRVLRIRRPLAPRAHNFAKIAVFVSFLVMVFTVWAQYYYKPQAVVERELRHITADYYENYFYPKFVALNNEETDRSKLFEKYAEMGFPEVSLRTLLLFDNQRHASSSKQFMHRGFNCDTNETTVTVKPVFPFGPQNYTLSFRLNCY